MVSGRHDPELTDTGPDPDGAFLDGLLGKFLAAIAEGRAIEVADVLEDRPDLRPEVERLVALAERIAVRAPEGRPRIAGYEVLGELGRGGMGSVYVVRDLELGRTVALKTLSPQLASSHKARERFEREARAMARLKHPHIIAVYEVGRWEGIPYFTMELVDGLSLAQVLEALRATGRRAADLTAADLGGSAGSYVQGACRLVEDAALALAHAHASGVIHRDVKPSNIMVRSNGRAMVCDFGLAKLESEASLTTTGEFVGTMHYVSPEQAAGRGEVGAPTDVHALGVTLYELLTLEVPFAGQTPQEVMRAVLTRDPTPPRRLNPMIPRDLETICLTALDKDARRRYASGHELALDLRRFLELRPIEAHPASAATRTLRLVQRHKAVATAGVLGALLVLGTPAALWVAERAANVTILAREADTQKARAAEAVARGRAESHSYLASVGAGELALRLDDVNALRRRLAAAPEGLRGWEWRYLTGLADQSLATLDGHRKLVASVAYAADGSMLASAAWDGTLVLWDGRSGELVRRLRIRTDLAGVAFSPMGDLLACSASDGTVRLVQPLDGRLVQTVRLAAGGQPLPIAFDHSGQLLACGQANGTNAVVDVASGRVVRQWPAHAGAIQDVAFQPGLHIFASAAYDGSVATWDADSGERRHEISTAGSPVCDLDFDRTGQRLAIGRSDGTLTIFDASSGDRPKTWQASPSTAFSHFVHLAWSPDGTRLATAGGSSMLRLWDAATGACLGSMRGHRDYVTSIAFHPHGRRIATSSGDCSVRLWDLDQIGDDCLLQGHTGVVHALTFSPDGERLVSGSSDYAVRIWDTGHGRLLNRLASHRHAVRAVVVHPSRQTLYSAGVDGAVAAWDLAHPELPPRILVEGSSPFGCAALGDGGQSLLCGSADGTVTRLDLVADKVTTVASGHDGAIWSVAVHPTLGVAATGGNDCRIHILELPSCRVLRILDGHRWQVSAVAFAHGGETLLSGGNEGDLKRWDWRTGALLTEVKAHAGAIYSIRPSPDGTRLATASWDQRVKLWDPSFEEVLTLRASSRAHAAVFSPDGSRLAVGAADGTIRVHDTLARADRAAAPYAGRLQPVLAQPLLAEAWARLLADPALATGDRGDLEAALARGVGGAQAAAFQLLDRLATEHPLAAARAQAIAADKTIEPVVRAFALRINDRLGDSPRR